ncbi:acyltransferase family protein [Derxia lacustris]|uniref:acyltransferase family protein n=1 Tax=Derxia lacustris TaxID=764842 RepID=UPI000A16EA22|nr:acyltransferase [Derxia lacustris]
MTAANAARAPSVPTLVGIQALRFVAAMLVVAMHGTQMAVERLGVPGGRHDYWVYGSFGVHIFFVISGVVMALSTHDWKPEPGVFKRFMQRRVIRILPMYWIATTLKLAAVLAVPAAALHADLSFGHLALSYLLIPHLDAFGEPFPLLGVGWTLSFEFFFYFVFSALLALGWPRIAASVALFGVFNALNQGLDLEASVTFFRLFSPLLFEFSAGMLIAKLCLRGWRLPLPAGVAVIALGFWGASAWPAFFADDFVHNLMYGLAGFAVVLGVTSIEGTVGSRIPRWLRTLGDASFALYLFHPFVMAAGAVFVKLGARTPALAVTAASVVSVLASVAIYRLVEQPLTNWLRRIVEPRRAELRRVVPPIQPPTKPPVARSDANAAPDTPRL